MEILNEDEFEELVKKILLAKQIRCVPLNGSDRKITRLKQDLFFDLARKHYRHMPDLSMTENKIPCELKSPKELYDICRFSRAHLCSYLLQTIYGQCFSYADLFRPNINDRPSIFLIIPKIVCSDISSFSDIENIFADILNDACPLYINQMDLASVEFQPPCFADEKIGGKYGKLNGDYTVLATKITYVQNSAKADL